ncbi:MAG: TlyA family RNA methyltransferase [Brachymonas sp.]|nr:TlyA family RNA methyltransferase [Brachymonas sp.]
MRADQLLVQRGLAASCSQAQRLIAAGAQWRLPGRAWQRVRKSGDELPPNAEIELLDGAEARYVSRGGLKLEGTLTATGLDVRGWRCLDVGQSTGGFTDCLLVHGAAHVTGVDAGHGQLHPRLAADARVTALEGVNARHLDASVLAASGDARTAPMTSSEAGAGSRDAARPQEARTLPKGHRQARAGIAANVADAAVPHAPSSAFGTADTAAVPHASSAAVAFDLIVGDLSFISLTLVLPALAPLLAANGQLLMLVKPQFELQPEQIGKGGIVRDEALYAQVEQRLRTACASAGLQVLQWLPSPIAGGDGNREFFIHAAREKGVAASKIAALKTVASKAAGPGAA